MKNIIIAAIVILVAVFIYTQMQSSNQATDAVAPSQPSETAPAAPITAPAALISAAPAGADVFILEPGDGTTVTSPVTIKFGLANMMVAPAGDNTEHSGHHHILIDVDELPNLSLPIPATDNMVHYGLGQTEAVLELTPGEHTLQLLLGNYLHIPHDPPVISKKITITVE